MLKESSLLIRVKMYADFVLLTMIIAFLQISGEHLTQNFVSIITLFNVMLCTLIWHLSARGFGLYADLMVKPFSIEWGRFLKAFGINVLLTSFAFFQVLNESFFSRRHFLIYCALLFLLLPMQKLFIRLLFKKIVVEKKAARKVLIVGAGDAGLNFYRNYVEGEKHGLQLTGFVDDEVQPFLNGNYLGKVSDIESVISQHDLDDIFVTLPITSESQIKSIVTAGEKQGKRVRIIPAYQDLSGGKMQVDHFGNLSVISLHSLPLDLGDNRFFKRVFDLLFSLLIILCLFSWLFPVIALIIKLTSKGPVFFVQDRWGLNNKVIRCYKFRSMISSSADVDADGQYQQARKNDPRITRIGAFMRKTNLDELPQFFNVLMGSMSIVGPRPHPVPLNMESKDSVERYMMRHWVKPGITGWAQVHGFRGETRATGQMKKRVKYDLWYIENWSFWLDQQIIVQTLVNMVKGEKNAF